MKAPDYALDATIRTDWPTLKRMAKEFFDAEPSATDAEAERGFECLTLGYLGMEGTDLEREQAVNLMQLAQQRIGQRDPDARAARRALDELRAFADALGRIGA